MNIQIRIQVPKPTDAASYVHETDVQVITDPTIVRAVLATIIACEAAIASAPDANLLDEYATAVTDEAPNLSKLSPTDD